MLVFSRESAGNPIGTQRCVAPRNTALALSREFVMGQTLFYIAPSLFRCRDSIITPRLQGCTELSSDPVALGILQDRPGEVVLVPRRAVGPLHRPVLSNMSCDIPCQGDDQGINPNTPVHPICFPSRHTLSRRPPTFPQAHMISRGRSVLAAARDRADISNMDMQAHTFVCRW